MKKPLETGHENSETFCARMVSGWNNVGKIRDSLQPGQMQIVLIVFPSFC